MTSPARWPPACCRDGFQLAASDPQRRTASVLGCDSCSHHFQRRDDSRHGAAGKRFVAGKFAGEILSRQDAAQHPHGRTGVAAVQGRAGRLQFQAAAVNDYARFRRAPHSRPEACTQASVLAQSAPVEKFSSRRIAFRDGRQHGVAVRDGLVPGQAQGPGDVSGGTHDDRGFIFHRYKRVLKQFEPQRTRRKIYNLGSIIESRPALWPRRWLPSEYPAALPGWRDGIRTWAFQCRAPTG